ncbi:MAG: hypothetical protein JXA82_19050 [Sedimentisphaerales bacterium]|nr:hypothetical protein [Sedimentisphaerales bacterium]
MNGSNRVLQRIILFIFGLLASSLQAGILEDLLQDISPDVKKWATVVLVQGEPSKPVFEWLHYRNSAEAVDFWPASTIKIYTVVAALEYINELNVPTDCVLVFEHKKEDRWILDSARTMREMISEVFRRSSNEDYTLLLRFVGIDRINTKFLIPEKGFPHSALMRDYITYRPPLYVNEEPQRITLYSEQRKPIQIEHYWSGISYAKQRGAMIISSETGNCTSTRELADCLRRIMFHHVLPASERYKLTDEQVKFIIEGGYGLTGLENREAGAYAWEDAAKEVFPKARFFHKGGLISTYSLDVAYFDDTESGTRFIVALAAESGDPSTVKQMAKKIAEWVRQQR